MAIYIDKSKFPLYRFNYYNQLKFHSVEESYKFFKREHFLSGDYMRHLNNDKNQDLFLFTSNAIISFVFGEDYKMLSESELTSDCITDKFLFLQYINTRINLKKIIEALVDIEQCTVVDKAKFLADIMNFTYKFFFVRLAGIIYCSTNRIKHVMDFEKYHNLFVRYSREIKDKNYNAENVDAKFNLLEAYIDSMGDKNLYDEMIKEIIMISSFSGAKKILNDIIEKNIQFKPGISITKENKVLIRFFKLITVQFFFPLWSDRELTDPAFTKTFNRFRRDIK